MHPPFQFQCEEFVVSYSMQDEIAARLAEGRFAMFRVHPTPDLPGLPFIYTVGLTDMGLPEIIISGPVSPWCLAYLALLRPVINHDLLLLSDRLEAGGSALFEQLKELNRYHLTGSIHSPAGRAQEGKLS